MGVNGSTPDPRAWGIQLEFEDVNGEVRTAPRSTVDRILEAMGADSAEPQAADHSAAVMVVTAGERESIDGDWSIRTEDGATLDGSGALPADLPLGYHELERSGGDAVRLIVAPPACPSATDLRWWGFALQLYSLRSHGSWGIGDLADLRRFGEIAGAEGASMAIVNPLHASLPGVPQEPSPYYPSTREFRSPLYLRLEEIPGASAADVDLLSLTHQAHALNGDRRIDRDAVWRLKEDALDRIWRHSSPPAEFERYCSEHGQSLWRYAVFCAISEVHGRPWHRWPSELRHPASSAVRDFGEAHADRVRFHSWVQWLLEGQLQRAGESIGLVHDLAIGVDPAGADAWLWQDTLALDMRVGAPPDSFNTRGQDWGLPPFDPWRLRASRYEPFISVVRAGLRHAKGLRVDHIMGLFRLYWIPEGTSPEEGAYVTYPWRDLLAIVALESQRAGAYVIGEDLGTVEKYMRDEMKRRNMLSYRLLWFENDPPAKFPVEALAAVTTHDLPTIAGLWSGSDLQLQERLGMEPNVKATNDMKKRVGAWIDAGGDAPVDVVTRRAHELLGRSPSAMVSATVEDAIGSEERPNYPGTTDEWPNWSLALGVNLEDLPQHEGFRATARALESGRKGSESGQSDAS